MTESVRQEDTEEIGASNIEKLRRFSFGVGFALLIYVIADGEFSDKIQSPVTPIVHFGKPNALLWAFIAAVLYSSYRYWYYGIHLAPTRTKMRAYLRSKDSILVFSGSEKAYEEKSAHVTRTSFNNQTGRLRAQLPPGLPRSGCICITHNQTTEEEIRAQVAKKLGHYFPGLKAKDISATLSTFEDGLGWAHVSSLSRKTYWLTGMENAELYLPLIVNGLALAALLVRNLWPWLAKILH